jgi:hypothetical protein
MIVEADGRDRFVSGLGVGAVQGAEIAHVVDDPQIVVDGRVLGHVADAVPQFGRTCRATQHGHRSLGDDLRADDASHQRCLAAA